jgi:hypothetical protein
MTQNSYLEAFSSATCLPIDKDCSYRQYYASVTVYEQLNNFNLIQSGSYLC